MGLTGFAVAVKRGLRLLVTLCLREKTPAGYELHPGECPWAARPGLCYVVQKLSPGLSGLFPRGFSASQILPTGVEVAWIDFENGGKVRIRERGTGSAPLLLLWARQNACGAGSDSLLMKTGAQKK